MTCLVLVAASCSRSPDAGIPDDELGHLVLGQGEEPRPIDVDRAASDPDELLRAAQQPLSQVVERLGPNRYTSASKTVVSQEAEVENLEVETTIDSAAEGMFHVLTKNSADYGFEVYFVGGSLYLAPRYSKLHRRAPEQTSEPAAIRDGMYGELAAYLELLARGVQVEDGGTGAGPGGRSVRNVTLAKAPEMRRVRTPAALEHRKWRDEISVTEAKGELAIDQETGVVLQAHVEGAIGFVRDGQPFSMRFQVDHLIDEIGGAIDIEAPAEDRWMDTPTRLREVDERDLLLEGIAPPTRRSGPEPAPEPPATPADPADPDTQTAPNGDNQ